MGEHSRKCNCLWSYSQKIVCFVLQFVRKLIHHYDNQLTHTKKSTKCRHYPYTLKLMGMSSKTHKGLWTRKSTSFSPKHPALSYLYDCCFCCIFCNTFVYAACFLNSYKMSSLWEDLARSCVCVCPCLCAGGRGPSVKILTVFYT